MRSDCSIHDVHIFDNKLYILLISFKFFKEIIVSINCNFHVFVVVNVNSHGSVC